MSGSMFPASLPVARIAAPIICAVAFGLAGIGYAAHEYNEAQTLTTENEQTTAQLINTRIQLDALEAKVDTLTHASDANSGAMSEGANSGPGANREIAPAKPSDSAEQAAERKTSARRGAVGDSRFDKLRSQVNAQGKEIDATRSDLADARTDLTNTRTELSGSIAKTHDELVVLEKKGERSYFEFDLSKTREFKREGPINVSLRKANNRRGYADLALIVDDRNLQQKHVNLYQPAMFYEPDSERPVELVINDISKDHIHGYVSAPKYRAEELAAMASANQAAGASQVANEGQTNSGQNDDGVVGQPPEADQAGSSTSNQAAQPELRQRLPLPGQGPSQE